MRSIALAAVAVVFVAVQDASAGATIASAKPARLRSYAKLSTPARDWTQQDSTVTCFESVVSAIVSPACFQIPGVQPGDCVANSGQFFVQAIFPPFYSVPHQVTGFGFLGNDGDTVFPSGGVVFARPNAQNEYPFPTQGQLANLQVTNIASTADTAVVFVDLTAANLVIGANDDVAIMVALQFPDGGTLTGVAIGPGIGADSDEPDPDCDFFTVDGGNGDWYAPLYDPNDPQSIPLDWGFVVTLEPVVAVEHQSWTHVKRLYTSP